MVDLEEGRRWWHRLIPGFIWSVYCNIAFKVDAWRHPEKYCYGQWTEDEIKAMERIGRDRLKYNMIKDRF